MKKSGNMCSDGGSRCGFTLVETMLAVVILAILALGGGAFMYRAGETVLLQRNKRAAIEAANRRMELVCATPYAHFQSVGSGFAFLQYDGATFSILTSDPGETTMVNGQAVPIQTAVRRMALVSANGSYATSECLEVRVRVDYRPGSGDVVELATSHFTYAKE